MSNYVSTDNRKDEIKNVTLMGYVDHYNRVITYTFKDLAELLGSAYNDEGRRTYGHKGHIMLSAKGASSSRGFSIELIEEVSKGVKSIDEDKAQGTMHLGNKLADIPKQMHNRTYRRNQYSNGYYTEKA